MEEFIKNFGIDWKLLFAQVVNFSILLFLLKRFVYKPVLEILKKRKQKIEEGLQFAKDAEFEMKRTEELREEVLRGAQKNALGIVSEAEEVAQQRKEEILKEASLKTETAIAEAKKIIQQEKNKMKDSLYKDTEELVREGIKKVIGRIPDEVRDKMLVEEALVELKAMSMKHEA